MTGTVAEFWWPSPEAFNDLEVTDIDEGWQLSAPDDTELAEWINYWSQSEEHHALFQRVFVKALTDHANFVLDDLENHGEDEVLPDGSQSNSEQAEDECPRVFTEYEPGGNSQPGP
jgi:hypothetical protein